MRKIRMSHNKPFSKPIQAYLHFQTETVSIIFRRFSKALVQLVSFDGPPVSSISALLQFIDIYIALYNNMRLFCNHALYTVLSSP